MAKRRILAIDVGNGYGKAAICINDKTDPIFLLSRWNVGMPTIAYIGDNGEIQIAHKARSKKIGRSVTAVKSFIGKTNCKTDDGTVYNPADVYGALAAELVRLANEDLMKMGEEPVYEVVITYPSSFIKEKDGVAKLEIMRKAVEAQVIDSKNMKVLQTISEAAAAALDTLYFERNINQGGQHQKDDKYAVVVCDIGHGTCDVSVVVSSEKKDTPYDIFRQDGDPEIGGKVFNDKLFNVICQKLRENYEVDKLSPRDMEQLKTQIVPDIKHGLTTDVSWTNSDLYIGEKGNVEITVERAEFERVIAQNVNDIIRMTAEQLEEAKTNGIKVDEIILTGGSSNIPMIEREVKKQINAIYPQIGIRRFRPERGVVFGAARYAAGLSTVEHPEFTYGIRYCTSKANMIEVCIGGNEELPANGGKLRQKAEGVVIHADVFRTKSKDEVKGLLSQDDCEIVQFFTFDVGVENKNKDCELSISIDKERRVTAHCTLPDGTVLDKNWFENK